MTQALIETDSIGTTALTESSTGAVLYTDEGSVVRRLLPSIHCVIIQIVMMSHGLAQQTTTHFPPISIDQISVIANRPLDNVYESEYDEAFCTETKPVIQMTTNDIKMFFFNFVPVDGDFPRPPPLKNQEYLDCESRGVIITKEGKCFYWHLIGMRTLALIDNGTNFCSLSITNDWKPIIETKLEEKKLRPPSSQEVLSFWNGPQSTHHRIARINIERERVLSFLDESKTNRFMKRCDLLWSVYGPAPVLSTSLIYKRDGALLCQGGKVIFWELVADDKLFLEDEKGASCLLEK